MKIKNETIALSILAKQSIIEFIKQQCIQPNEKLPSEIELMEMLGVSRYTVRESLALLEQDKIIYKVQGKGTFVNKVPIKIESGLEKLESITEIIKSFGYNPSGRCLKIEENAPTEDMIDKLNINKDEKVITFTRIRSADEKLVAFCVDTVPKHFLEHQDTMVLNNMSMFDYLSTKLNIYIENAVAEIIPTLPTMEMIKLMNVRSDDIYLLLRQTHYDKEGRPVIYSMDYFNPEVFKFKINRIR